MSILKDGVADRVAYGSKSGIDVAIRNELIPKGTFVVAKTENVTPELMFYDTIGEMKHIVPNAVFGSQSSFESYVDENEMSVHGESELSGRFVAIYEGGAYTPYLLQANRGKTALHADAFISSVNQSQFSVSDKKLSLHNVPLDKVVGLAEALEEIRNNLGISAESGDTSGGIVAVKLNGEPLKIDSEDGSVDIPMATAQKLGLVKHSDKNNQISIDEDGTMSVTYVSLDRLVDSQGDLIVFCCGDSGRLDS